MVVYFAVLMIPIIAALTWQRPSSRRNWGLFVYFLMLLAFVGLRDEVGPDWEAYEANFEAIRDLHWTEFLWRREPGFALIAKLSSVMGLGVHGMNLICAFLFLAGVFTYARITLNPWLSLAMVVPYLVFVVGMSGIRQAAALGLMFLMLATWDRTSLVRKSVLILLAMSIHFSAVFFFVFLVFKKDRFLVFRVAAALVLVLLSAGTLADSEAIGRYHRTYIEANVESSGAYLQVMLNAFPAALYLCFRKQILGFTPYNGQVNMGAVMALIALLFVPLSTTGISRIALYLSFLQMWVYPAFVHANVRERREPLTLAVAGASVVVFLVYFMLGSHAPEYLPYRSILFRG